VTLDPRIWLLAMGLVACGASDDTEDDEHPSTDSGAGTSTGSGGGSGDDGDGTGDDGGSGSGDGGGGSSSGSTGDEPFEPRSGTWTYTGGNLISDGCNTDELGGGSPGSSDFELTNTGDGEFVMKYATGDPWRCTLTEQDFSCDALSGAEDVPDYDVTIQSSSNHWGSFTNDVVLEGEFTVDIDCSGSDCSLAEWFYDLSFPCQVTFDASAELSG